MRHCCVAQQSDDATFSCVDEWRCHRLTALACGSCHSCCPGRDYSCHLSLLAATSFPLIVIAYFTIKRCKVWDLTYLVYCKPKSCMHGNTTKTTIKYVACYYNFIELSSNISQHTCSCYKIHHFIEVVTVIYYSFNNFFQSILSYLFAYTGLDTACQTIILN